MTSGWRGQTERVASLFDALRGRGQSETLGVALLTAIVVILVAVIGVFLFADFTGDDEEQLLANIQGDVTAEEIILDHEGGDSFEPDDIVVLLQGDVERDLTLADENFNETGGSEGSFSPGDTWVWEDDGEPPMFGEFRMFVIHDPTNTVLFDQPQEIGVETDGVNFEMDRSQVPGSDNQDLAIQQGTPFTLEVNFDDGVDEWIDVSETFDDIDGVFSGDPDPPGDPFGPGKNAADELALGFADPESISPVPVDVTATLGGVSDTDTIQVADGDPPEYEIQSFDVTFDEDYSGSGVETMSSTRNPAVLMSVTLENVGEFDPISPADVEIDFTKEIVGGSEVEDSVSFTIEGEDHLGEGESGTFDGEDFDDLVYEIAVPANAGSESFDADVEVDLGGLTDTASSSTNIEHADFGAGGIDFDVVSGGQVEFGVTIENRGELYNEESADILIFEDGGSASAIQPVDELGLEGGEEHTETITFAPDPQTENLEVSVEFDDGTLTQDFDDSFEVEPAEFNIEMFDAAFDFDEEDGDIILTEFRIEAGDEPFEFEDDLVLTLERDGTEEVTLDSSDYDALGGFGHGDSFELTGEDAISLGEVSAGTTDLALEVAGEDAEDPYDRNETTIEVDNFQPVVNFTDISFESGGDISPVFTVENAGDLTGTVDELEISGDSSESINTDVLLTDELDHDDFDTLEYTLTPADFDGDGNVELELRVFATPSDGGAQLTDSDTLTIEDIDPPEFEVVDLNADIENGEFSADWTIENTGGIPAPDEVTLYVHDSNAPEEEVGTYETDDIAAEGGTYADQVTKDIQTELSGIDGNTEEVTVRVESSTGDDMVITIDDFDQAEPVITDAQFSEDGDEYSVESVTVENQGDLPMDDDEEATFWLDMTDEAAGTEAFSESVDPLILGDLLDLIDDISDALSDEELTATVEALGAGDQTTLESDDFESGGSLSVIDLAGSLIDDLSALLVDEDETVFIETIVEVAEDSESEFFEFEPPIYELNTNQVTTDGNAFTFDDETLTVPWEVQNTGNLEGDQTVEIIVNGEVEYAEDVPLAPDETSVNNEFEAHYTDLSEVDADDDEIEVIVQTPADEVEGTIDVTPATLEFTDYEINFDDGDVTAEYTIENTGDFTSSSFDVDLRVDGSFEDRNTESGLGPGENVTDSDAFDVSADEPDETNYDLEVKMVSPDDEVSETFTVDPSYLEFVDYSFDFSSQTAFGEYTIENVGNFPSDDSEVEFYVDGDRESDRDDGSLDPGEQIVALNEFAEDVDDPGTQNFDLVLEMDSGDEVVSESFTINGSNFEVTIDNAEWDASNTNAIIDYTVENTGDFSDSQNIDLVNDGGADDSTSLSLDPEQSVSEQFVVNVDATGTVEFTVSSDDSSDTDSIQIQGPDLTFTTTSFPSEGEAGSSLTITYTVTNEGDQTADDTLRLSINNDNRQSESIELEPGGVIQDATISTVPGTGDAGFNEDVSLAFDDDAETASESMAIVADADLDNWQYGMEGEWHGPFWWGDYDFEVWIDAEHEITDPMGRITNVRYVIDASDAGWGTDTEWVGVNGDLDYNRREDQGSTSVSGYDFNLEIQWFDSWDGGWTYLDDETEFVEDSCTVGLIC